MIIRLAQTIQHITHQHPSRYSRLAPTGYWRIGRFLAAFEYFHGKMSDEEWEQLCAELNRNTHKKWTHKKLQCSMRMYQTWKNPKAISNQLSWSHYRLLMKIEAHPLREQYHQAVIRQHWTCTQLKRQIQSRFFERSQTELQSASIFKNHYSLEFTGLPDFFTEQELEEQLLQQLAYTLLEMGSGYSFVARQKRIVTPTGKQFFIDLIFYHTQLKAYILIDLKRGELSHRDLGQMDAYLRLYDELVNAQREKPSLGLILCTYIDPSLRQYSLLQDHPRIRVATYALTFSDKKIRITQ